MLIRNWIKGEVMDLGAVLDSIVRKEAIEGAKIEAMSKLKSDRATVDKMS
jgi:hypothetical protein